MWTGFWLRIPTRDYFFFLSPETKSPNSQFSLFSPLEGKENKFNHIGVTQSSPKPNLCIVILKVMATHSSILAGKIPWTEEPGGRHSPRGHEESNMTEQLITHPFKLLLTCTY